MPKSYLDELHDPRTVNDPFSSAVKAVGLDLMQILPTALKMVDLRYVMYGNEHGFPPGIYFITRYFDKNYGYIITRTDELDIGFLEQIVLDLVRKARKDKTRRLILL